ncbi:MAG: hypothetical protein ACTSV7_14930 [Candidatus Baldrarchaeia archaeon]
MAKKADLDVFKEGDSVQEEKDTYRCICGEEFPARWRYQLHLKQCKIAKLTRSLSKKEPGELKFFVDKVYKELKEKYPELYKDEAELVAEVPQGSEKTVETKKSDIKQVETRADDLLVGKIKKLYGEIMPGGDFYDAINKKAYTEPKPARFLMQVSNDFMTRVREVLQELLDRVKYGKELL